MGYEHIEAHGNQLESVLEGFGVFRSIALKYMVNYGLASLVKGDVTPRLATNAWHPLENWLSMYRDVAKEVGDAVLFQVGAQVPKKAIFPPAVVDAASALRSLDVAYHMNHRLRGEVMFEPRSGRMLEGIGHYQVAGTDRAGALVVADGPYPSEFDRGLLSALVQRFAVTGKVQYEKTGAPDRRSGGVRCMYRVTF